jgi:hypothetical protein
MKIHAAVLAALLVAPGLFAAESRREVAQLKDVQGNVLVSRESGLGAGREGLRLTAGTRVITTNRSGATVVYDNGCEVKLKENERFEVETDKPCAALASAPQSILATPEGAIAAGSASAAAVFAATLPALGGVAAGLEALHRWREGPAVSPS